MSGQPSSLAQFIYYGIIKKCLQIVHNINKMILNEKMYYDVILS